MEQGYRAKLIDSAKLFRTNWIQFGEILTKVASKKLFLNWGYVRFEDYCMQELKIRKNTAIKLTKAYFFLSRDEPDLKDKQLDLEVILAQKNELRKDIAKFFREDDLGGGKSCAIDDFKNAVDEHCQKMHKATQTCTQWMLGDSDDRKSTHTTRNDAETIWNACEKAHGWEEE